MWSSYTIVLLRANHCQSSWLSTASWYCGVPAQTKTPACCAQLGPPWGSFAHRNRRPSRNTPCPCAHRPSKRHVKPQRWAIARGGCPEHGAQCTGVGGCRCPSANVLKSWIWDGIRESMFSVPGARYLGLGERGKRGIVLHPSGHRTWCLGV